MNGCGRFSPRPDGGDFYSVMVKASDLGVRLRRSYAARALFAALLYKLRDQTGPACLMARPNAGAVVAVEVLVEQ